MPLNEKALEAAYQEAGCDADSLCGKGIRLGIACYMLTLPQFARPREDGEPPVPEYEARAKALHEKVVGEWVRDFPEEVGTRGSLDQTLRMLDRWTAHAAPANEFGQVTFARAMLESAAEAIRAHLKQNEGGK